MGNFDWIQYNIYTSTIHEVDGFLERLIKPVVIQVKAGYKIDSWFFIRYLDETGSHIRLRFLVDQNELADLMDFLECELNSRVQESSGQEFKTAKRVLPFQFGESTNFSDVGARVELSLYEPEVEKYGGPVGTELSERLFQVSSELVMQVIQPIYEERVDRFWLGVRLLDETLQAAIPNLEDRREFLDDYICYWSGEKYRNDTQMSTNLKKSAAIRSELTRRVLGATFGSEVEASVKGYVEHVRSLCQQLSTCKGIDKVPKDFYFHYIHMMNNRLGIWPIEEAYLAALLYHLGD